MFFLQGPPGTGKTTAIVEIVLQVLKKQPQAKILIASETHVAVDNAIDRLSVSVDQNKVSTIFRYKNFSKGFHFDNKQINQATLEEKANSYWSKTHQQSPELTKILWKRLNTENNNIPTWLSKNIADKHQIIGVTCNQMEHIVYDKSDLFDLVIIDECSKATLPEWLMPLSVAKKIILVGDHKQLPPTFCREESDTLKELESYQEKLIKDGVIDKLFNQAPEWMRGTLLTQYRMQPNIGEFISTAFYNGQLNHGKKQSENNIENFGWLSYKTNKKYPKARGAELINPEEVEIINQALASLAEKNKVEKVNIAIITPYLAQCRLLRQSLLHHQSKQLCIEIATIDAFQGREADIVYFSFVRNIGSAQFYGDERRLNVALSRAKNKIFLVGCLDYFKKQRRHPVLMQLVGLPVLGNNTL